MANRKLSNLVELTTIPASTDQIYVNDGGTSKRITYANFIPTFDVKSYGAVVDGVTDDSTAIQAAIDAADGVGGGAVLLSVGTSAVSSSIDLSGKDNVWLLGVGSGGQPNLSGDIGSRLLWTGTTSTSNVVVKVNATSKTVSNRLIGFQIDCDLKAGIGLQVYSNESGRFEDLTVTGYTSIGYDIGVNATEDGACHNMIWTGIHADQESAVDTVPVAMQIDGSSASIANTNHNNFFMVTLNHRVGKGLIFKNSDQNWFWNLRCEGTGDAVEFQAGASADKEARGNYVWGLNCDGAIIARAGTASSNRNVLFIDAENTTVTPTVESGAALHYSDSNGLQVYHGDKPDVSLIGTSGFAQVAYQDTGSTSGAQAVKWRMASDNFRLQRLNDDLTLDKNALSYDLANDVFTFTSHTIVPVFTDATRGAAGTAGRVIFNTTDGQLNIDDGTNWTLPDGSTT